MTTSDRSLVTALLAALLVAACAAPPDSKEQTPGKKDPNRCATCHIDDFRSAREHVDKKPLTCFVCHDETSFRPAVQHHPWPLTGAHEKTACFACHKTRGPSPVFAGTPRACAGCHAADFDRGPSHVIENFSTRCEQCHDTSDWHHQLKTAPKAAPKAAPRR